MKSTLAEGGKWYREYQRSRPDTGVCLGGAAEDFFVSGNSPAHTHTHQKPTHKKRQHSEISNLSKAQIRTHKVSGNSENPEGETGGAEGPRFYVRNHVTAVLNFILVPVDAASSCFERAS